MLTLLNNPQYFGLIAAICLVCLALFATPSIPLISAISQFVAKSKKKSFYDKFGKQLTRMGLLVGGTALAALVAGAVRLLTLTPDVFYGPLQLPIIVASAITLFSFALLFAYFKLWKSMRKNKGLHAQIGLITSVTMFAALFATMGVVKGVLITGHPLPSTGTTSEIFLALYLGAGSGKLHLLYLIAAIAGFALCGTFGQTYLLARREKDDFGRDYYKFALPYCAKWAVAGATMQLAAAAALFAMLYLPMFPIELTVSIPLLQGLLNDPLFVTWMLAIALPLIACIFWITIIFSATPMRRKVGVYCAAIIMLIANIALILVLLVHYGYQRF